MQTNPGVSDAQRDGACRLLNILLADQYVLAARTRNYHWNVSGPHFYSLHLLFEKQYAELDEMIDNTAERVRALAGRPLGSLTEFVQHMRLKDEPDKQLGPREMVTALLGEHEALIQFLRKDVAMCGDKYHDAATTDFLTRVLEAHEKMAWMLRATLQTA